MTLDQACTLVKHLAKLSSDTTWEYDSSYKKPYPEGSGEDRKATRTGISMAWERNEAVDPGSETSEPSKLNPTLSGQP